MAFRVVCLMMLCALAATGIPTAEDEKLLMAIREANSRWMSAFDASNAEALAECYTEDGRLMPPGADVIIGREEIAKTFASVMASGVKRAILSVDEVGMIHTDKVAYERSHFAFYNAAGSAIEHGKYVVIWKNITGHFYLYTDIFNSNAKTTAPHWLV